MQSLNLMNLSSFAAPSFEDATYIFSKPKLRRTTSAVIISAPESAATRYKSTTTSQNEQHSRQQREREGGGRRSETENVETKRARTIAIASIIKTNLAEQSILGEPLYYTVLRKDNKELIEFVDTNTKL